MTIIDTTELPLRTGEWNVDTVHSNVEFTVRHLGISKVRGRFNTFTGALSVGNTLADTRLRASVDLSSVDTNNPDRDAHLRSTDFFDIESHPTMAFESSGISEDDDGYRLDGELTLNGVTKPISFAVEFNGAETYPMDQLVHAGFSASAQLSRKDYGVDFDVPLGADKMAIGDKVAIELEIQVVEPS